MDLIFSPFLQTDVAVCKILWQTPIRRELLCLVSPVGSFMTNKAKGRKGHRYPCLQMSPVEFLKCLPCGDLLASSGSGAEEADPVEGDSEAVRVDCHHPGLLLRRGTCNLVFT